MTGEEIRTLRRSLGLNQPTFAKALEVTERTVRRWETGETQAEPYYRKKMRELREKKFHGTITERPLVPRPKATRPIPAPSVGTGRVFGIPPSSW